MGDFLIDFRDRETRGRARERQAGGDWPFAGTKISVLDEEEFTLVVSRPDDLALWGPATRVEGANIIVALAGRPAFTDAEWNGARALPGAGGLACRRIAQMYLNSGLAAISELNGNFAVAIFNRNTQRLHVATDRFGMTLCYGTDSPQGNVIGTHPDVVANTLNESADWDTDSFAQFIATGYLTHPHTFHRNVKALDFGSIRSFDTSAPNGRRLESKRFFKVSFSANAKDDIETVADDFARAFRQSVEIRSAPTLGKTAVALSGGLDSRAILSSVSSLNDVTAFTLYDAPNIETKAAQSVANAAGVELQLIQRRPDYYGENFEEGAAISAGICSLASNHFLGIRSYLQSHDVGSLLTGCYCDYLFKGLAQNVRETRLARIEKQIPFSYNFYRPHYPVAGPFDEAVRERFKQLYSYEPGAMLTEEQTFEVEVKRCFPLANEADCAQRVIPQRVLPWNPPAVDNSLMNIYQRLRPEWKRDGTIFRKMLHRLCPPSMLEATDSNLGTAAQSSPMAQALGRYTTALQNRFHRMFRRGLATRGSWPNWEYYLRHSPTLQSLWSAQCEPADQLLPQILGSPNYRNDAYRGNRVELALRILTLKAWLMRSGSSRQSDAIDERCAVPHRA